MGNKNRNKYFDLFIFSKIIYNYRNIYIYLFICCFIGHKKMNLIILKLYINIFLNSNIFFIIRIKYYSFLK
jgi:hypothetical protein